MLLGWSSQGEWVGRSIKYGILVPIYRSPRRHPSISWKSPSVTYMWRDVINTYRMSVRKSNELFHAALPQVWIFRCLVKISSRHRVLLLRFLAFFFSVPQKNTRKVPRDCFLSLLSSSLLNIVQSFDAIHPWLLAMLKLSLFKKYRGVEA